MDVKLDKVQNARKTLCGSSIVSLTTLCDKLRLNDKNGLQILNLGKRLAIYV
jgi:hypothetical protein